MRGKIVLPVISVPTVCPELRVLWMEMGVPGKPQMDEIRVYLRLK